MSIPEAPGTPEGHPWIHPSGVRQFDAAVEKMPELLRRLLAAPNARRDQHPHVPPVPGIYLFSETDPVYVGQTRDLRRRLGEHTRAKSAENEASFAFLIGKQAAATAGLDIGLTRKRLQADPAFAVHFKEAKERVAGMDVCWIELRDPIERTLFEIYASLALNTVTFNSFETH